MYAYISWSCTKIDICEQVGHSVWFNIIWAEVVGGGSCAGCVNNSPTPIEVQLVQDYLYKSIQGSLVLTFKFMK